MLREQIPNFFRLYLNPYVVQTCFCLSRYLAETWPGSSPLRICHQSFLANSFDEALSGAIKLARYCNNVERRSPAGLVIDPGGRLGHLASLKFEDQGIIEFVPRLMVAG